MDISSFNDQVVLITGAASGFGRLLAERLAAAGAKLVLGDIEFDSLARFAAGLRDGNGEVAARRCDVSSEAEVAALVKTAVEQFGRLDIAVNNAGIGTPMKALIDIEEAEMDRNFAVNTKGVFFGMKYQIRQMLEQGGGIVLNVASLAGLLGAPKLAAYAAAKHGVVGLTRTAAVEYGSQNIRINAICPFYSPTPLVESMGDASLQAFLAQGAPMKRLGTPEEMVEAMLMLIAPENSYLHGQAIAVDGGTSAL